MENIPVYNNLDKYYVQTYGLKTDKYRQTNLHSTNRQIQTCTYNNIDVYLIFIYEPCPTHQT